MAESFNTEGDAWEMMYEGHTAATTTTVNSGDTDDSRRPATGRLISFWIAHASAQATDLDVEVIRGGKTISLYSESGNTFASYTDCAGGQTGLAHWLLRDGDQLKVTTTAGTDWDYGFIFQGDHNG